MHSFFFFRYNPPTGPISDLLGRHINRHLCDMVAVVLSQFYFFLLLSELFEVTCWDYQ